MKLTRWICWLSLSLFAVTLGLSGCNNDGPGEGAVGGTVRTQSGNPISAATVEIAGSQTVSGSDGSFVIKGLASGDATLTANKEGYQPTSKTVTVPNGGTSDIEVKLAEENKEPVVDSLTVNPDPMEPGGSGTVEVLASDENGDSLSFDFQTTGGFEATQKQDAKFVANLTAPDELGRTGALVVTVTDGNGGRAKATADLRTVDSRAPTITDVSASPSTLNAGETALLEVSANDPDGDTMDYSWSAPDGWQLSATDQLQTRLTAPDSYGEAATVTVTVTDEHGVETSADLSVTTKQNEPPQIRAVNASPPQVEPLDVTSLTVDAVDPEGDDLTYSWSAPMNWTVTNPANAVTTLTAPGDYDQTAKIEITVTDSAGASTTGSVVVTTPSNDGPRINSFETTPNTVKKGGTITAVVGASDPNGDVLSYQWSISGNWSVSSSESDPSVATVTAPNTASATGVLEVTVQDAGGGSSTATRTVSTQANSAPSINKLLVNPSQVAQTGTIRAEVIASDPNGDSLSYSWTVTSPENWTISGSGPVVDVNPPRVPSSTASLKIEVTDSVGASTSTGTIVETNPNQPPIVSAPSSDLLLSDGENPSPISISRQWEYQIEARDKNQDPLSYAVSGITGASVDSSGKVTWTPAPYQQGATRTLILEVSDGYDTVRRKINLKVGGFDLDSTGRIQLPNTDGAGVADFDGNDTPDIAVVEYRSSNSADITVALATDSGYRIESTFKWASNARRCASPATGDMDGDGDADVVVVCDRGASQDDDDFSWYVWKNDGTGNFSKGPNGYWNVTNGHNVRDVEIADINGDGALDVVAAGHEAMVLARNDGTGNLNNAQTIRDGNTRTRQIELADVDGGKVELIASGRSYENGNYCGNTYYTCNGREGATCCYTSCCRNEWRGEIRVFKIDSSGNRGSRIWQTTFEWTDEYVDALAAGDLNDDGNADIVAMDDSYNNELFYFESNGNGGFNRRVNDRSIPNNVPNPGRAHAIGIADMDNDGNNDVVYGTESAQDINIAFGTGEVGIRNVRTITVPAPYSGSMYGVFLENWNPSVDNDIDVIVSDDNGNIGVAY